MPPDAWRSLIDDFLAHRTDARAFHDRFFEAWHAMSRHDWRETPPPAIETLFYVVEAYCPDPALRDPASPYEADEAELRTAAETARTALGA